MEAWLVQWRMSTKHLPSRMKFMTSSNENSFAELVLRQLVRVELDIGDYNRDILKILLKDFLACSVSGKRKYSVMERGFPAGMTQNALRLGLYGSADDLDDVNWRASSHSGTIIWATAISAGFARKVSVEKILSAAAQGYRTGSTIAKLFGSTHGSKWHITATSGVFSSVSAAAFIFDLTPEQHMAAFKLCATNMGGLLQARFEREGATQFNRSAAITLGLSSVQAALLGASHVQDIWSQPGGLVENFAIAPEMLMESNEKLAQDFIIDGISTTHLRLFPCTGFAHAAAVAIYELRLELPGTVTSISVELSKAIASLMDGSRGGDWWNPQAAIAAVAYSKDPMVISEPKHLIEKISLSFSDIPVGGAKVTLQSEGVTKTITHLKPPGSNYSSPLETKWRNKKWQDMLGEDYEDLSEISNNLSEIARRLL